MVQPQREADRPRSIPDATVELIDEIDVRLNQPVVYKDIFFRIWRNYFQKFDKNSKDSSLRSNLDPDKVKIVELRPDTNIDRFEVELNDKGERTLTFFGNAVILTPHLIRRYTKLSCVSESLKAKDIETPVNKNVNTPRVGTDVSTSISGAPTGIADNLCKGAKTKTVEDNDGLDYFVDSLCPIYSSPGYGGPGPSCQAEQFKGELHIAHTLFKLRDVDYKLGIDLYFSVLSAEDVAKLKAGEGVSTYKESYIKFLDIMNKIPKNAVIKKATLVLTTYRILLDEVPNVVVKRLDGTEDEQIKSTELLFNVTALTGAIGYPGSWNSKPVYTDSFLIYGKIGEKYISESAGGFPASADVTEIVRAWKNGSLEHNGFRISKSGTSSTPFAGISFHSFMSVSKNSRPRLIVEYCIDESVKLVPLNNGKPAQVLPKGTYSEISSCKQEDTIKGCKGSEGFKEDMGQGNKRLSDNETNMVLRNAHRCWRWLQRTGIIRHSINLDD